MIRNTLDSLYKGAGWLAALFLSAICLLVVCQVVFNVVDRLSTLITGTAIGLTIPSYSDFTGFFLAAASFLALTYTMRSGHHIRVTLIRSNLPHWMQEILEGWCLLFASATSAYFTYYTANLVYESYIYHDLSSGMIAIPIWIPQASMLIGLALLTISLSDDLLCHICGKPVSYNKNLEEFAQSINE
ncbi:TRAP transporter small permease [Desulfotalea psychrophila]|uniref:Probable DctQ (C4-dicarboxylate permease, small subunit) n=1 Tax=Desulfotalea psychrophila (strain LSv54 / DSM 12343) TaxID=177439 RepID=Q6ANI7_DESPS|nr:TRAP transporter small permease [Desulfotalea psychrophila]CAG36087.1 probable DctQ (C4-dicarboxylate permease, small subunit) [Desulfotalea psychrophila LSv54]